MKLIFKTVGLAFLALAFTSCEKEKEENLDAFDDAVNTELEQRDFEEEDDLGNQECASIDYSRHFPEGVIVIDTMETYPKTIVIDYGDGVENSQGRIKSGQVLVELSQEMSSEGAVKTITFNEFKVGEASVEGYRIVTNLGSNEEEHVEFSIEGEISIEKNGIVRTKTFVRKRSWVEGYGTCEREDDVFLISGTSTVACGSRSILKVVTIPIKIAPAVCDFPIEGEVSIEKSNGKSGVLNFGSGDCDSEATLTLHDGEVKTVDLEKRRCRR